MRVRIYKPCKNAMQSGRGRTGQWRLEYETTSARRPEALMGWSSSEDTLNQVSLRFASQEEAIDFATKKGWDYILTAPHERKLKPRNYGDNFRYVPPEQ